MLGKGLLKFTRSSPYKHGQRSLQIDGARFRLTQALRLLSLQDLRLSGSLHDRLALSRCHCNWCYLLVLFKGMMVTADSNDAGWST
jgi:hypothetical protein